MHGREVRKDEEVRSESMAYVIKDIREYPFGNASRGDARWEGPKGSCVHNGVEGVEGRVQGDASLQFTESLIVSFGDDCIHGGVLACAEEMTSGIIEAVAEFEAKVAEFRSMSTRCCAI